MPRRLSKKNRSLPVISEEVILPEYQVPKSVSESDYKNLYSDLKQFYQTAMGGKLTTVGVTKLVRYTMQVVEANKKLSGEDKKNLVLAVSNDFIQNALNDSNMDDGTKDSINLALSFSPMLIDAAVDYSNNMMNGNNGKNSFCLCC